MPLECLQCTIEYNLSVGSPYDLDKADMQVGVHLSYRLLTEIVFVIDSIDIE